MKRVKCPRLPNTHTYVLTSLLTSSASLRSHQVDDKDGGSIDTTPTRHRRYRTLAGKPPVTGGAPLGEEETGPVTGEDEGPVITVEAGENDDKKVKTAGKPPGMKRPMADPDEEEEEEEDEDEEEEAEEEVEEVRECPWVWLATGVRERWI